MLNRNVLLLILPLLLSACATPVPVAVACPVPPPLPQVLIAPVSTPPSLLERYDDLTRAFSESLKAAVRP